MIIFPAIDIKDGKVVRLLQGNFDEVTEYSGDPVIVAKKWQERGAPWLHVVDLDGAKTGEIQNWAVIQNIVRAVNIPIQIGGGIRDKDHIQRLFDTGIARVVLGTRAVADRAFLKDILSQWKDKIAVSLDCLDGKVTQRGWTEVLDIEGPVLARELESYGLAYLIYTDVKRDGMLQGPNWDGLRELLKATKIPVIASGGISGLEDIRELKTLEPEGVAGAIIGKALYEGKVHLEDALKAAK